MSTYFYDKFKPFIVGTCSIIEPHGIGFPNWVPENFQKILQLFFFSEFLSKQPDFMLQHQFDDCRVRLASFLDIGKNTKENIYIHKMSRGHRLLDNV